MNCWSYFRAIENLESEIALLKILVQQTISDKRIGQDILVDNVVYLGGSTDQDSILINTEIIEEDAKPRAKASKKEQLLEAHQQAREWVNSKQERKRECQGNNVTQEQGS
jgi:hypothetical protein